jgi:hypothetical protein
MSAQWLVLVSTLTKLSNPLRSQFLVHVEKCFVLEVEIHVEDLNFMSMKLCLGGDNYVWKIQSIKETVKIILRPKLKISNLYQ